jgi:adenine-specific DNA-methyltransferase
LEPARAICSDFLAVTPFPVQAVIGNPPYVRLRHAPADEAERALQRAEEALGEKMDPSGSVWMPFVLHASRFPTPGGRLAYVLPYDITYRRYARVLWEFLGKRFGSLRVVRVGERIFPDILQEAVLLYADDYGASTDTIRYDVFDTRARFLEGKPTLHDDIPLADVVAGERRFTEALQATLVSSGGGYYAPPNEISVFTGFYNGSGLTNNDVVVTTLHSSGPTNGYNFAITAFC